MTQLQDENGHSVDAVVIGAGFSGLAAAWRLKELGLTVQGFDRASGPGGVWYWNQYPGARTDTPQRAYRLSFHQRLVKEWKYSHEYPKQPEVLDHLNWVADEFHLRELYHFGASVTEISFDDETSRWTVRTDDGMTVSAKYVVTGLGLVSEGARPQLEGLSDFKGEVYYTNTWPHEPVDFTGKRVALIGVGSTGVQLAPHLARDAAHLTVFQRTPNYVVPIHNREVSDEDHAQMVKDFEKIQAMVRGHSTGFPFPARVGRSAFDVTDEERDAVFEELWGLGGFAFLHTGFDDLLVQEEANRMAVDFIQRKIRSIVKDPRTAEKLTPNYFYGAKRPPTSVGYYELFNEDHVRLVDLFETPIEKVTETGIRTSAEDLEYDVIVFAAGFLKAMAPFKRIDITGPAGVELKEHWSAHARTYLGMSINKFPNFFMVAGPQSPFANLPPGADLEAGWIVDLIRTARERGVDLIEVTAEAEARWTAQTLEALLESPLRFGAELAATALGIPHVEPTPPHIYTGGHALYSDYLEAEKASHYASFLFDGETLDAPHQPVASSTTTAAYSISSSAEER